ncbi:MAG TPA: ketopantoate reductase family protein [Armatimonadetes bacterium]|nr:ketopantoate reductase family protein [Armatimonadota bacterium]
MSEWCSALSNDVTNESGLSWAIVGAGGIGLTFATMLAASGQPVVLVCRSWQSDALIANGSFVTGLFGEHRARPSILDDVRQLPRDVDVYAVATKAYDTETVASLLAEVAPQSAIVVSLQNGLGNVEALMRALPQCYVLGARIIFGAERIAPNGARVTVCADDVVIAPKRMPQWRECAQRLVASCRKAHIPARTESDIEPWLWAKVLYNAALNPLGALLNMTYGELANDPLTRAVMNCIINEAFAVAAAIGAPMHWESADDYREHFYTQLVPPTSAHRSSMLQDLSAGKRTEIDALNGALMRIGEEHGIATPFNAVLTAWVKRCEAGERINPTRIRRKLAKLLESVSHGSR